MEPGIMWTSNEIYSIIIQYRVLHSFSSKKDHMSAIGSFMITQAAIFFNKGIQSVTTYWIYDFVVQYIILFVDKNTAHPHTSTLIYTVFIIIKTII